jgi:hypothetical protein
MSEINVSTEIEVISGLQTESAGLPEALRKQFMYPDEWIKEQEAVEMENQWISAERDEVVQYVKTLKMLSVYLTGKTSIPREKLLGEYFRKVEQNFPEYLQKEMEIILSA